MNFNDLPLHDGLVKTISINWPGKSAEIFLDCFLMTNPNAQPCILTFSGISSVDVPMTAPWGESNSINTARVQKNTYQIELQSGDTLQLEATTFGFDTIGSYPPINSLTAFAETRTCEAASPSCLTRLHPLFKS
ncbi:hypothetical protein HGG65_10690 [Alteromonadaceae bacterium A_SAG4]|nr:hypothetical protein [Alteromonadaceae bacterium A_SAG4]NKX05011.1 hypothetical protein [Alteromonadaceae bacterium A_SAG6]NKX19025.1 hypothetical protein [Alteromonadaceae bacterium A_SAG5]NKX35344.1 hypothetical protein [Alteromonadaceae bacterium A_SAG3]